MTPQRGSDSDADSDITLEDDFFFSSHLYPLQRFAQNRAQNEGFFIDLPGYDSDSSSSSQTSISSSVIYDDIDFEALVDELMTHYSEMLQHGTPIMMEPSLKDSSNSIMVKSFPRTSPELLILLELNHEEFRQDPWNPAPHLLHAIERGDLVFLCQQGLIDYDKPPLKTVANCLDLIRQTLEGLTFLHEHNITGVSCLDPSSLMMDIGIGTCQSAVEQFDRLKYPVRYYFTNFSNATKSPHDLDTTSQIRHDVQESGRMLDEFLAKIPPACPKLDYLTTSMRSGDFTAEQSRILFESLCRSLESSIFDIPIPTPKSIARTPPKFITHGP